MIIAAINNVSKNIAGTSIFEDLTLEVHEGDRIGITGPNGSGKTTLMKLVAKTEAPDDGAIHLKKGMDVGYLAQIPVFPVDFTVHDVLSFAFEHVSKLGEKMKELEFEMANPDHSEFNKVMEDYATFQEQYARLGGYEIDSEIAKVANGLGIEPLLKHSFTSLSGGEQTKVSLGFILLKKPELLLLDEPTNHLDLEAVEWLEDYLSKYEGSVVIISHDRLFLNHVVTKVVDLEDGELHLYKGNYTSFIKQKQERLLQQFAQYKEQQKKIKKMKEAIKRLRQWANEANPPNEKLFKRAASMQKALDRMEKLKKPMLERKKMALSLEACDRSGKEVVMFKDVRKSFGDRQLFKDVNMTVYYQNRTAIVGANGSGKSTLLKILLNEENFDKGEAKLGSNVKVGYLAQHVLGNVGDIRVIDVFREEIRVTEEEARHMLAKFMFYGHTVFQKVTRLSGGERMRLRLAQLMHQNVNLLLLDEPTNHLDIDSREVLEEALLEFEGTILCVSHDRYFLNKLFDNLYWLERGTVTHFHGNYSEAKMKRDELVEKENHLILNEDHSTNVKPVKKTKERFHQNFQMDPSEIETKIEKLEDKIVEVEASMMSETHLDELVNYQKEKDILQEQCNKLYRELEECLEKE